MRLLGVVGKQGLTLVPLSLYYSGSRIKVELGLCRGKKLYDKRDDAAKKDVKRELERNELNICPEFYFAVQQTLYHQDFQFEFLKNLRNGILVLNLL